MLQFSFPYTCILDKCDRDTSVDVCMPIKTIACYDYLSCFVLGDCKVVLKGRCWRLDSAEQ